MLKNLTRLWLVALAVAWAFDFLFWKKLPGVSFPIFVILCLAGGLLLVRWENIRPGRASLALLLPVGFFTAATVLRLEPFTVFLSYILALSMMALLAHTFLGGRWMIYGIADYVVGFFSLAWSAASRAADAWAKSRPAGPNPPGQSASAHSAWRSALPALRGLALALPVLAVFSALLASADPIFSRRLSDFLSVFNIDKLPEYLFRITYILFLAYALAGIYLHALTNSRDERLIGLEKPLVAPFFGLTEAAVILGSVDLLFLFFVGIQFRYFFGGQANIRLEGYTYSEYARRGFGELVVVALFSLLLFLGLSAIARRDTPLQRRLFSGMGVTLVVLVSIILVSAFQRLLLYEQAYGFSRLRAYTHVFMFWVGVLLAAVVGLEMAGRLRYFALAGLIVSLGFGASLPLMNVDGFIARENVKRAATGQELDALYLSSLSADAVPALIELHRSGSLPPNVRAEVGGVLACQAAAAGKAQPPAWQSFHLASYRAARLLDAYVPELQEYPVWRNDRGSWMVKVGEKDRLCFSDWME